MRGFLKKLFGNGGERRPVGLVEISESCSGGEKTEVGGGDRNDYWKMIRWESE